MSQINKKQVSCGFLNRIGKVLITKVIARQWLFVLYPHFALQAQKWSGTDFLQIIFVFRGSIFDLLTHFLFPFMYVNFKDFQFHLCHIKYNY